MRRCCCGAAVAVTRRPDTAQPFSWTVPERPPPTMIVDHVLETGRARSMVQLRATSISTVRTPTCAFQLATWRSYAFARRQRPRSVIDRAALELEETDRRCRRRGVPAAGFRVTAHRSTGPMPCPTALGFSDEGGIWVKDETANVGGSHKARHLFTILASTCWSPRNARWPRGAARPNGSPLAISSCGNAAIAAAVIARAWRQRIEVFVPEWADGVVVAALMDLGARVQRCERRPGEPGDPCMARFREAVSNGAVPFGCQGPDNGAHARRRAHHRLGNRRAGAGARHARCATRRGSPGIVAHGRSARRRLDRAGCRCAVRGGARRSSVRGGRSNGAVSTAPCGTAVRSCNRGQRSQPAPPPAFSTTKPTTGAGVAEGLRALNGVAVVANEDEIVAAHRLAHLHTSIDVDATGSAGLAGLLAARRLGIDLGGEVATIFTGRTRT